MNKEVPFVQWIMRQTKFFVMVFTSRIEVSIGHRVPTHTRKTGKPGKMREVFPVRKKSGNFRISPESQGIFYQSGKIRSENNNIILWAKSKNSCFQT